MEFYSAFRKVEIRGNFLVGETIRNARKNFFLAAREPHLTVNGLAGFEQFAGFFNQVLQNFVFSLNQNGVVIGTLPPNETMHGEQPRCLIYGKSAIRASLHMKMGYSRVFLVKEKRVAVGYGTSS